MLPRIADLIYDVLGLLENCEEDETIYFLVLDFVDAFFRVPLNPEERDFFTVEYAGKFLQWNRVAQVSTNGPQVFGRLAALVGRLTQSCFDPAYNRLRIYMDDPILAIRGREQDAHHNVAKAVLLWRCTGMDLAFPKGQFGSTVCWVGHGISINRADLSVNAAIQRGFAA